jgi:hypothetical protein
MTDRYAYWQAELAEPHSQHRDPPGDVMIDGWWRIQAAMSKTDYPAVVWMDSTGKVWAQVGRAQAVQEGTQQWFDFFAWSFPWAVAVTKEQFDAAVETGRWEDGKQARRPYVVKTDAEAAPSLDPEAASNTNGVFLDEELRDQIDVLIDAGKRIEVKDQASANKATEITARLRILWKRAEGARKAEKEPLDLAIHAVQAKWTPMQLDAAGEGSRLDDLVRKWLREEQKRIDDEEAQKRAASAREAPEVSPQPDTGERQRTAPAPKAAARSAYGRARTLRTVKIGVITDETKFIKAIRSGADFQDWIGTKANSLARGGVTVPGMKIEESKE